MRLGKNFDSIASVGPRLWVSKTLADESRSGERRGDGIFDAEGYQKQSEKIHADAEKVHGAHQCEGGTGARAGV